MYLKTKRKRKKKESERDIISVVYLREVVAKPVDRLLLLES